jgi:hypothetical protein
VHVVGSCRDRVGLIERLRRPRTLVLLALLVLVIGVRIALPTIVRDVAVSQADAALVGRIALADVELSLLRGGVTLHGLEVYADELPAPRSADAAADADAPSNGRARPPASRWQRSAACVVRIGWLPPLRRPSTSPRSSSTTSSCTSIARRTARWCYRDRCPAKRQWRSSRRKPRTAPAGACW